MKPRRILHRSSPLARVAWAALLFFSCARALDEQNVSLPGITIEPPPDASTGGTTGGEAGAATSGAGAGGTAMTGGAGTGGVAGGGAAGMAGGGMAGEAPDGGMMDVDAGGGMGGTAGGGAGGGGTGGGGAAGAGAGGGGNGGGGNGNTPNPVRLEAEAGMLGACGGCVSEGGGESGNKIFNFQEGDQICWANVDMDGITMATVHYGNGEAVGDTIDVTYGGTIATLTIDTNTGGWSYAPPVMMADTSETFSSQTGTGTVCLVGHGTGQVASVDYLDLD